MKAGEEIFIVMFMSVMVMLCAGAFIFEDGLNHCMGLTPAMMVVVPLAIMRRKR